LSATNLHRIKYGLQNLFFGHALAFYERGKVPAAQAPKGLHGEAAAPVSPLQRPVVNYLKTT
jgi:hypothetical protein